MSKLVAVILAGGSGTRLWPFSRQLFPKQFMSLDGDKSLLAATVARLAPLVAPGDVWVVTGSDHASGAGYAELKGLNVLVEPAARNTAPAMAVIAAYLADFGGDPVTLFLPADHVITDVEAFHKAAGVAIKEAEAEKIVTFGIKPSHAETGYGYIKAVKGDAPALPVEKFVEKPDAKTAEAYLKSGDYSWNSGMFVARASVLLGELEAHAPKVAAVVKDIRAAWRQGGDWQAAVRKHFEAMPNDSIDYAVMEKSRNVMVVPCDIGWSDVGSWDAVYELGGKDADGNVVKADAVMIDARNNLLMGGKRLVAAIGVEDLCIVDTPDALLVSRRDQAQQVKQVVDTLKKKGGEAHVIHRTAKRPWGSYTVLEDDGRGYKIKRIEVVPGGRLSLQSHKHRSEHWVVVSGVATVTCGEKVTDLHVNQSTYIPLGEKHRLENRGTVPVQMVEVQVGEYLGEDDIVRYDDVYGRS